VDVVLRGTGDAREGPTPASRRGPAARALPVPGRDGVELAVDRLDPGDGGVDRLLRRDLTAGDAFGDAGRVVGAEGVVGEGADPGRRRGHAAVLPDGSQ